MAYCGKCLHLDVCKTAETCDGHVPRCKHFMDKAKYVEGETYTEEDVRNAYQAGYSTGMEQGMEKGKDATVKHGRWVDRFGNKYANHHYECSECKESALYRVEVNELGHERFVQALSDNCPHCGARMDGDGQ